MSSHSSLLNPSVSLRKSQHVSPQFSDMKDPSDRSKPYGDSSQDRPRFFSSFKSTPRRRDHGYADGNRPASYKSSVLFRSPLKMALLFASFLLVFRGSITIAGLFSRPLDKSSKPIILVKTSNDKEQVLHKRTEDEDVKISQFKSAMKNRMDSIHKITKNFKKTRELDPVNAKEKGSGDEGNRDQTAEVKEKTENSLATGVDVTKSNSVKQKGSSFGDQDKQRMNSIDDEELTQDEKVVEQTQGIEKIVDDEEEGERDLNDQGKADTEVVEKSGGSANEGNALMKKDEKVSEKGDNKNGELERRSVKEDEEENMSNKKNEVEMKDGGNNGPNRREHPSTMREIKEGKDRNENEDGGIKSKPERVLKGDGGEQKKQEVGKTSKEKTNGDNGVRNAGEKIKEVGEKSSDTSDEKKSPSPPPPFKPDPNYTLGPKVNDWDEQRLAYIKAHPGCNVSGDGRPLMMLVTATDPKPCQNPMGDYLTIKFLKNKIDYCRRHKIELFFMQGLINEDFDIYWSKLPLLRTLMLKHPEVEWFWWMDSDAMFTDMKFKVPLDRYEKYNMVIHGWKTMVYDDKDWFGINAGIYLMRNNKVTLDLLDEFASYGVKGPTRRYWGPIFHEKLKNRPVFEGDDQATIIWVLNTHGDKWSDKIYIESKYTLHGFWLSIVDRYEEMVEQFKAGKRRDNWPFITHFVGCKLCGKKPSYDSEKCYKSIIRAFHFADNQVLSSYGFTHPALNITSIEPIDDQST